MKHTRYQWVLGDCTEDELVEAGGWRLDARNVVAKKARLLVIDFGSHHTTISWLHYCRCSLVAMTVNWCLAATLLGLKRRSLQY